MPNPQDLTSYNFQSNPFMELLGQGQQSSGQTGGGMPPELAQMMQGMGGQQSGQPQQASPQPTQAQPAQAQPQAGGQMGGQPEMEMEEEESQYNKGQNPDRGKPLLTAIQALENYIVSSTERDEILTARGIISLLTKLVARDQEAMMKE